MQSFGNQTAIFKDETVLYEDYFPEEIPEREDELEQIHNALAPVGRGAAPRNTFIYGKTGQGKSVTVEQKLTQLKEYADAEVLDLSIIQYNCNNDSSSYQVACHLIETMKGETPNGHDTTTVFNMLYEELQNLGGTVIIVLDEIDNIGSDDELLYELPRGRANGYIEDMWVGVIGISNNFNFRDNLSPKVQDSLCEEEIQFPPYDANQLTSILERRADKAFHEEALEDDVIPLCAALAAQDKGSARQALRYLYQAGELATNSASETVREDHVREAETRIQRKSIEKGIRNLTLQDQLALAAIISLEQDGHTDIRTRTAYDQYKTIAEEVDANPIAMRRVRDHMKDLAMTGILDSEERTTGVQGGKHYRFRLKTELEMTKKVLKTDSRFSDIDSI